MSHVSNLVISCIDFRFREKEAKWINDALRGEADLVSIAGASKSIVEEDSQKIILHQIEIAKTLHGIREIHIIDHIDCGAYGGSQLHKKKDDEVELHSNELKKATDIIRSQFPDLHIHTYLLDFDDMKPLESN